MSAPPGTLAQLQAPAEPPARFESGHTAPVLALEVGTLRLTLTLTLTLTLRPTPTPTPNSNPNPSPSPSPNPFLRPNPAPTHTPTPSPRPTQVEADGAARDSRDGKTARPRAALLLR